jgi:hypothetical protein
MRPVDAFETMCELRARADVYRKRRATRELLLAAGMSIVLSHVVWVGLILGHPEWDRGLLPPVAWGTGLIAAAPLLGLWQLLLRAGGGRLYLLRRFNAGTADRDALLSLMDARIED